jgi:serine/threonine protein phosphatase PrpC
MIVSVTSSFSFFGINPGEILSVLIVLIYARNYGFQGGAAAGAAASFALMTGCSVETGWFASMGLAGAAAGGFVNFGRPAAASAYVITSFLAFVLFGSGEQSVSSYVCMALGALIFCFIPVEKLYHEQKIISNSYDDGSEMPRMMTFRMKHAADTLEGIAADVNSDIREKNSVYRCVCAGTAVSTRLMDLTAKEYLGISRGILRNQLSASSGILRDMSHNVSGEFTIDRRITARMKKCFDENDIGFSSAAAYYNGYGRLFAEVYCTRNACISGYSIYKAMSGEFGKNFECTKCYDGDEMRFLISERPRYSVETDVCQRSSEKEAANGDTCDCFRDDYGNVYMVISDGMGTGNTASEYSGLAVSSFRKLILGGIDISQSIEIVNSMLMIYRSEEGFATLDVIKINLDSGNVNIYKSGAAPTLFRQSGSVFSLSSSTYPLGVSDDSDPYTRDFTLRAGDTIVMISDGVPEEAYGVIKRELNRCGDVSRITETICSIAGRISNDDISIIAARLIRQ